ncbi:unnamed protein product [Ectocarpus sp. 6 AP-2014]
MAVAVKAGESDMSESEELQNFSQHDIEATEKEHESSRDDDVTSEVGNADFRSADQERQKEAEATLGIDCGDDKEEEEKERGEREEQREAEQQEEDGGEEQKDHEEHARRGKRKLGGTAEPPPPVERTDGWQPATQLR